MSDISLGDRIRLHREVRGFSASDLARVLDVTPTAVWNWEKNGVTPRPDMLASIAKAFGMSVDALTSGDDEVAIQESNVSDIIEGTRRKLAKILMIPHDQVRVLVEVSSPAFPVRA